MKIIKDIVRGLLRTSLWSYYTFVLRETISMMTSSNGNLFRVTGHLCGESAQRPVSRSFDVFFDLRLNKRLSKQLWGWWLETLSHPLWRHRNALNLFIYGYLQSDFHHSAISSVSMNLAPGTYSILCLHLSFSANLYYHTDVTISIVASKITGNSSISSTVFQAHIKEHIKAPRHCLCEGNPPVTDGFPSQRTSSAGKMLPLDDFIMTIKRADKYCNLATTGGNLYALAGSHTSKASQKCIPLHCPTEFNQYFFERLLLPCRTV